MLKQHGVRDGIPNGNPIQPQTLADIGITKKQGHVAQRLADLPLSQVKRIPFVNASGDRRITARVMDFPERTKRASASRCCQGLGCKG